MKNKLFPQRHSARPTIYAYRDAQYPGQLKVGFTSGDARKRVAGQYPTKRPGKPPYTIVVEEPAMRPDGSSFTDHDVHRELKRMGIRNTGGEWFSCTENEVRAAITALQRKEYTETARTLSFAMRPEQREAAHKTMAYFKSHKKEKNGKTPHFLWNAKMRFGKTFAAYQLARAMGWKKLLVLTFKPAVESAWQSDLAAHADFAGWQFTSRGTTHYSRLAPGKPFVCFGSFQDFLGRNEAGGIKAKNEWVHRTRWDCVILDEYHYGAWRESAKDLFSAEDKREAQFGEGEGLEYFDEAVMPITTGAYLYLSGTPFRAIASGEFIEEQIFNWTYADEQRAKLAWKKGNNPYAALPRLVLLTYRLPDAIADIAKKGEFNEFDLNTFFTASGEGNAARFTYENEVQRWLDLIRGGYLATSVDNLRTKTRKPPLPYYDVRLLQALQHTLWFLPSVAACHAMRNLLRKKQNNFYHGYQVVVAAGQQAGIGADALLPVRDAMDNPLNSKTITLSCGKLTTGVTVKPWTGIFMLRNTSSPETYFQAAFRVQSPWVIKNPDGLHPNEEVILKEECYVFDFAPERALRLIAEYSSRLDYNEANPEKKVAEFIKFLPVLAYDGSRMVEIDAAGVLDLALSGTTATLLARRWESALLVNVDNETLKRLMANTAAMDALMKIEAFRSLNKDIETIINRSDAINKIKEKANQGKLKPAEKEKLSGAEKEYRSKRKEVQEKLIKFATRIPVFLYLTDYRERSLRDVITELEPALFKKVTGLQKKDFELLLSMGLFNTALMNDAVFKFKRYEDASLAYTGIVKHKEDAIGLYDTVLSRKDAEAIYGLRQ